MCGDFKKGGEGFEGDECTLILILKKRHELGFNHEYFFIYLGVSLWRNNCCSFKKG